MKDVSELGENFKKLENIKVTIDPTKFGLPSIDEFKNRPKENFTLSEMGYDLDKIFDSKIKEHIKKLLDKDRAKKNKLEEKAYKKMIKSNKKWGSPNLSKNLKKIEKDIKAIKKLSENGTTNNL